jgi:hypothetical protein
MVAAREFNPALWFFRPALSLVSYTAKKERAPWTLIRGAPFDLSSEDLYESRMKTVSSIKRSMAASIMKMMLIVRDIES